MAVRECIACGAPVTSVFCDRCGTVQPSAPDGAAAVPATGGSVRPPVVLAVDDDDDDPEALRTTEQPWHPFEQPSWLAPAADPRAVAGSGGLLPGDGADFMGISRWEVGREAEVASEHRRPWLLGGLAAAAVVVVLAAVAFFALRSATSADGARDTPAVPPAVTVTAEESTDPAADSTAPAASDPAAAESAGSATAETAAEISAEPTDPAADPMGGPVRDIACAPGYVVQIASGPDEATFVSRVAELRAAGELPADAAVARTASSCAIFEGQANSIVLYAGPYTEPYQGCEARLTGAPDSFIKGTTPETATEYVSCLCPADISAVPTVDAEGATGVWVGELQRILANRLNIPVPDLGANWGTFSSGTAAAVRSFQEGAGLPATGTVDAATWQALQQKQC